MPTPTDPKAVVPGRFIAYRQPDAVRAAALANAVELLKEWQGTFIEDTPITSWTNRVLETARLFEDYLTGEEAHG